MLDKAWNSKEEMPYCFPRSSIKFQGHTGQNITDFDPNWAFPNYRPVAALNLSDLPCYKMMFIPGWYYNITLFLWQHWYLRNVGMCKCREISWLWGVHWFYHEEIPFCSIQYLAWEVWVFFAFRCGLALDGGSQLCLPRTHITPVYQYRRTHADACWLLG